MSPLPPGIMSPKYGRKPLTVPKGKLNAEGYIDGGKGRRYWPVRTAEQWGRDLTPAEHRALGAVVKEHERADREARTFSAWVLGAAACKTGLPMKSNPGKVNTAEWRAWGRGFRAWERDAKHRK